MTRWIPKFHEIRSQPLRPRERVRPSTQVLHCVALFLIATVGREIVASQLASVFCCDSIVKRLQQTAPRSKLLLAFT
jgi:hypothetical protein